LKYSLIKRIVSSKSFKAATVLGVSHAMTLLLGLASTVVWTKWMPVETYGQFKVIQGVISFAAAFCLIGASQVALMSATSNADGNLARVLRRKLLANLGGSLLILSAAGYYFLIRTDSGAIAAGLVSAAVLFSLYNLSDLWMAWFNGKGSFGQLAVGRLVASALALCTVLILVVFQISYVWQAVVIFLGLVVVQNVLMLKWALRLRENSNCDIEILQYGRHASIALMFTNILGLDVVFLENFHLAEEVALYSVALVLPTLLKTFFGIIGQVVAPQIYAADSLTNLWASFKGRFIWLTLGFVLLGLVGFMLIPKLVTLLFSHQYSAAGDLSKWLWLVIASVGSFTYLGSALLATKNKYHIYIPNAGYTILLIMLSIVFIDYGAGGMIYARCISAILLATYYCVAFFVYISKRNQLSA